METYLKFMEVEKKLISLRDSFKYAEDLYKNSIELSKEMQTENKTEEEIASYKQWEQCLQGGLQTLENTKNAEFEKIKAELQQIIDSINSE